VGVSALKKVFSRHVSMRVRSVKVQNRLSICAPFCVSDDRLIAASPPLPEKKRNVAK